MHLFSEKVNPTLTNSPFNAIQVENFEEIFFGVYEIEINKTKYPVEKISEHKGNPVVSVPVTVKGKKNLYPFVVIKGKFDVLFNEQNTIDKIVDNYEPVQDIIIEREEIVYPKDEDIVVEKVQIFDNRKEILLQIEEAKQKAKRDAIRFKKKQIEEANNQIRENKRLLDTTLQNARDSLVTEFVNISRTIKDELISDNDSRFSEISETIDNKIQDLADTLKESINQDFESSESLFDKKIKEIISEMFSSKVAKRVDDEMKAIAIDVLEKIDTIEEKLESKLGSKVDSIVVENIERKITSVQQANIELNDTINKGVNRALSRVGNVNSKVDELTIALYEEVDSKIEQATDTITSYYTEKLQLLEDRTFDLTEETRRYIIDIVNESKNSLISEIRNIKDEKPIEYIIESRGKKEKKSFDSIQKELDKTISDKVSREITNLRKYIAVYSGGGSVAQQFADGGVMNGPLTASNFYVNSGGTPQPVATQNNMIAMIIALG